MLKAPPHTWGQTPRFGLRAVTQNGKRWYKTNDETKYFPEVHIDADSVAHNFLTIYQWCMEYHSSFLF